MKAPLPPTHLGEAMLRLLECSRQALEDDGNRAPGLVHLVPGISAAWDNCCEDGGQLYVRVVNQLPVLPQNVRGASNCGPVYLSTTLAVGILRCTPTVDDAGLPPTAAELTASALEIARDAQILQQAIQCCYRPASERYNLSPPSAVSWEPLGAEGGCAGGEWTLTVGLPSCAPC